MTSGNELDQRKDGNITLNIGARVPVTEAEGPGKRFAIWVQGCPMRCPGCCNPHLLEFREAERLRVEALYGEIMGVRPEIEGITVVGGEPFSQASGLAALACRVRREGLSVMIFTGFTLAQLQDPAGGDDGERAQLLAATDLLVDGPYRRELHQTDRRWIGSSNQKVHFFTDRYRNLAKEEGWDLGRNTLEIRLKNGELLINGFPHDELTGLNRVQVRKRRER